MNVILFSGQNDCNYPPTPYSTQSSRAERLNSNEPSPPPEEIRSSSLPTSSAPNADYGALLDKIVYLEVRFSLKIKAKKGIMSVILTGF